jgi:hypothetical protein
MAFTFTFTLGSLQEVKVVSLSAGEEISRVSWASFIHGFVIRVVRGFSYPNNHH